MTTQRRRAANTVGTRINKIGSEVEQLQNAPVNPGENSVGPGALQENSVGPEALQPESVESTAIARGAVGTENLGVVNEVTSDSILTLMAPYGVGFGPISHPRPTGNTLYSVQMDSRGYLLANPSTMTVRRGTIDLLYTAGRPSVTFEGETVPFGPVDFSSGYRPVAGQVVNLMPNAQGGYLILGSVVEDIDYPNQIEMFSLDRFSTSYEGPSFTKTGLGIVALKGVITSSSAGSPANRTLYTLPEGFRPDADMDFGVSANSGHNTITVRSSGAVVSKVGIAPNSYISLQNVMFPAAGVASWVEVQPEGTPATQGYAASFVNGFRDGGTSSTGTPAFWVDTLGYVWWRGYVMSSTSASSETPMITVSTQLSARYQYHIGTTTSSSSWAYLTTTSYGGIKLGTYGVSAGFAVSLAPIVFPRNGIANANMTYLAPVSPWANYLDGYTQLACSKRSDGIVWLQGLVKGGSIGGTVTVSLPIGMRPSKRSIASNVSNSALGRLDIQESGSIIAVAGSNVWFSLDSRMFVAEG